MKFYLLLHKDSNHQPQDMSIDFYGPDDNEGHIKDAQEFILKCQRWEPHEKDSNIFSSDFRIGVFSFF
jgi:hypothetical protein